MMFDIAWKRNEWKRISLCQYSKVPQSIALEKVCWGGGLERFDLDIRGNSTLFIHGKQIYEQI